MRFFYSLLFLLCFGILAACGGTSETTTPEPFDPLVNTWPHDLSDITPDADVVYGQLENGMRYALQRNSRPEGEAVLRFWMRAGSRNEAEDELGIAHYLEHMAFNGSENVPEGEMVKSLERLGLSFGADTNAFTSFSRTQYMLNLPEVDDETVDYALLLMRETADRLLIEPDAVDRERGVVKAEEARGNTPGRAASRAFQAFAYPDAFSTHRPVIGTPESLDAISAEQLRLFYDNYYRPERAFLVLVGDFDIAEMEQKIRSAFEDWNPGETETAEPDNGSLTEISGKIGIYNDDELTTQLTMFDVSGDRSVPDTLEARRRSFVHGYAASIVNQRIRKKVLSPDAPVRSAGLSSSTSKLGTVTRARASAKDDDWKAAIMFLDQEIRQGLEYGFQQAEYDELIARSRRSLTDNVNYAAKRRSGSLADGIVGAFHNGAVRTTPQQALDMFEANVAATSLDDLEAAFRETWSDFDPAIWLQGPKVENVSEDEVRSAYLDARSLAAQPPETRETLEFAYQDFGAPGKVQSTHVIEDFGIEQIVFENNVKLNLKKTDFEDSWIRLQVTVGEGWNAFPKSKPALIPLAGSFALGGYEAHPISEVNTIFAGKKVGVGMQVGSERLNFSGGTNPDDVEDQLKAWTALLLHPGYRPEWKQKFLEGIQASFHTIDSTPGGVAARDLPRIWANGDRRFGYLEQPEYEAADIADIRAILEPIMAYGAIEIGVVGDFDRDAIIAAVAKTYGALPKRKSAFDRIPEAFEMSFPDPGRRSLTHTGADNQGAIHMAWPTSAEWTQERQRAYSLIRRVFQNRLTDVTREDLGLTYSPSARLNFSERNSPYGYAAASMTADPQYFNAFEEAVLEIARNLRSGDITEDELMRARKPVLESFERSDKENGAWLSLVTVSQTRPDWLEHRRTRDAAYAGFTAQDLNVFAGELFKPGTQHVILINPEAADND